MRIKGKLYIYIAFLVLIITACDNIGEENRYIEVKPNEVKRAVLIEEFTGQNCINCPEAHEKIEEIQKMYGKENVIPVCIYSTPLAEYPLKTKVGELYAKHWKVESLPCAIINRYRRLLPILAWNGVINKQLQNSTPITLSLIHKYSKDNNSIDISVTMKSSEPYNGKLQVWITEDKIPGKQSLKGNKEDKNYIHNNVFRAAVNGTWGVDVNLKPNVGVNSNCSIVINPKWKAENINIVAFLYNDKGVEQVIKRSF